LPLDPAGRAPQTLKAYVLGAAALVLLVALMIGFAVVRRQPDRTGQTYTQLTNFTDAVVSPALSPDGKMLAFYRSGNWFLNDGPIYVKLLPNGEPVQIAKDPRAKYGLSFSPDGTRVAYTVTEHKDGWKTYTVPSIGGGEPRLLMANSAGPNVTIPAASRRSEPALIWES
jgi:Tol biopolymer transport system component